MIVKELRNKLAGLPDQMSVVVHREESELSEFYDINDVGLHRGTPQRDKNGKPGFTFDSRGAVEWLFISVSSE